MPQTSEDKGRKARRGPSKPSKLQPIPELSEGNYKMLVDLSRKPPSPIMRGQEKVQWRGKLCRDNEVVVFMVPQHGTRPPWWGKILGPTTANPQYLMDELKRESPLNSVPDDVDVTGLLGQVQNIIDHSNDEHWDEDGLPSVSFFNGALEGTGLKVGREEISAFLPNLVRQTN